MLPLCAAPLWPVPLWPVPLWPVLLWPALPLVPVPDGTPVPPEAATLDVGTASTAPSTTSRA